MKIIAITLIKIYQSTVSPILPPTCRYYPTCSNYAVQAYEKYGFFKGTYLALSRIVRCNPLFPGGYDPVK